MNARGFLAFAVCVVSIPAYAQSYPAKPVRLVVPFPAGGPNDIVAREIGRGLGEAFGQSIVIDNRPGASGAMGTDLVARATPDAPVTCMVTSSPSTPASRSSRAVAS